MAQAWYNTFSLGIAHVYVCVQIRGRAIFMCGCRSQAWGYGRAAGVVLDHVAVIVKLSCIAGRSATLIVAYYVSCFDPRPQLMDRFRSLRKFEFVIKWLGSVHYVRHSHGHETQLIENACLEKRRCYFDSPRASSSFFLYAKSFTNRCAIAALHVSLFSGF